MELPKYSIGTGDRFGQQGIAQLNAVEKAWEQGIELGIVWNKSHREHTIVKTSQQAVRKEADTAVSARDWKGAYFVDADHIGPANVDLFIESSDFFTLDVADFIDRKADEKRLADFTRKYREYIGELSIAGIKRPLNITAELIQEVAEKYLFAIEQAGNLYRYIKNQKGDTDVVIEVSMDETSHPQSPVELLFILAAMGDEKIPAQTIAPKFSGRFNKGVDYAGDIEQFHREFEDDICIIKFGIQTFNLPANLKLSVHSGSDKFSIYRPIREAIRKHDVGIHLKTAGTTWLEELIGLAESGGQGLEIAKQIYIKSFERFEELCAPYASVIDIDRQALPGPDEVKSWTGDHYVKRLRHDQLCPDYDVNVRQLLHVGYKVAAEMQDIYLAALAANQKIVAENVTENLYSRHIVPLFL